jgi:hypothetical protein
MVFMAALEVVFMAVPKPMAAPGMAFIATSKPETGVAYMAATGTAETSKLVASIRGSVYGSIKAGGSDGYGSI